MTKTVGLLSGIFCLMLISAFPSHADCNAEIDALETSFNDRMQTEKSKLAAHPMVLKMGNGDIVDMRGQEPDAKPTERWFVTDKDAIQDVRSNIERARSAFSQGDVDTCEKTYDALRERINQQ